MFKNTQAFSGFSVNDLDSARKFYADTLEIEVEDQPGMGFGLMIAGGHAVFIYQKQDHIPATYTVLNFLTSNIDETVDELVKKGIVLERYEGMQQDEKGIARGIAANRGPDIAWFKDPSGNILSVLQDK